MRTAGVTCVAARFIPCVGFTCGVAALGCSIMRARTARRAGGQSFSHRAEPEPDVALGVL